MAELSTRGRGRPKGSGGNKRPDKVEANKVHTEAGDNARYMRNCLWVYNLPPIDISDANQVGNRITEYFNKCIDDDLKPTVSGMSMALGVDRRTFNNWCNGVYRSETHLPLIKKAHEFLENMMENYMMNGKINPVAGIFLMKNNHGYSDQQEVVITPNNPLGEETSPKELEDKYAEIVSVQDVDDNEL